MSPNRSCCRLKRAPGSELNNTTERAKAPEHIKLSSASAESELRLSSSRSSQANPRAKGQSSTGGLKPNNSAKLMPNSEACPKASAKKESCRSTAMLPTQPPKMPLITPPISARCMKGSCHKLRLLISSGAIAISGDGCAHRARSRGHKGAPIPRG